MVFLEAVQVFHRGNFGLYHGSAVSVIRSGICDVRLFLSGFGLYHYSSSDVWRSGGRLAFVGVHHHVSGRTDFAYDRCHGTVYCQNLSGNEASADLHCQGGKMNLLPRTCDFDNRWGC